MIRFARAPFAIVATAVLSLACYAASSAQPIMRYVHVPSWRYPTMRPIQYFIRNQSPMPIDLAWLGTDGSIIGQSYTPNLWYKYTPDSSGDYSNGTWTEIASLQSGYNPTAFSSAVLANGKLAITGGEYNAGENNYPLQLTNLGAVYDPIKDTWTPLGHPSGWDYIGDSPNSVLPDGEMFVGNKLTTEGAVLNPKSLKWTKVRTKGKSDFDAEEGFTLLPDGTVLTADVKNAPNSEIWTPSKGAWKTAGSTIVDLHSVSPYQSCLQYGPNQQDCYLPPGEIGPSILRPDGTVFYTGSASGPGGSGPGHTAIYDTNTKKWKAGPDFPNGDDAGDSFAALLPSGNVLVFGLTGTLYEWNGTSLTGTGSWTGPPLLLPTGQVLMFGYSGIQLYQGAGQPQAAWAPTITTMLSTLKRGKTYKITGTQFNGLSQAISFGDEYQNTTNYPLVRITNKGTGHVFYARTHDHSTMGVATGKMPVFTFVDIPPKMETGASMLEVVANGIPSNPMKVTIN